MSGGGGSWRASGGSKLGGFWLLAPFMSTHLRRLPKHPDFVGLPFEVMYVVSEEGLYIYLA